MKPGHSGDRGADLRGPGAADSVERLLDEAVRLLVAHREDADAVAMQLEHILALTSASNAQHRIATVFLGFARESVAVVGRQQRLMSDILDAHLCDASRLTQGQACD